MPRGNKQMIGAPTLEAEAVPEAWMVTTPNKAYDGETLGVSFRRGKALVDEGTADLFKLHFPDYVVRKVNPLEVLQSVVADAGLPAANRAAQYLAEATRSDPDSEDDDEVEE